MTLPQLYTNLIQPNQNKMEKYKPSRLFATGRLLPPLLVMLLHRYVAAPLLSAT